MAYVHPGPDNRKGSGCVLWRSSEPTYALYSQGSTKDRDYLSEMKLKKDNTEELVHLQIFTARGDSLPDMSKP